jgi:hemerythrin superfamily protein
MRSSCFRSIFLPRVSGTTRAPSSDRRQLSALGSGLKYDIRPSTIISAFSMMRVYGGSANRPQEKRFYGIRETEETLNALRILEDDHQKVRTLFQQGRNATDASKRRDLFDKIDRELEIHAHIEETVLYPALREYEEFEVMVADAGVEHQRIEFLLIELEDLGAESYDFDAKLQDLTDAVEQHIHQEEEQLFKKISEFFDEHELERLGRELEAAKGTSHHQVI